MRRQDPRRHARVHRRADRDSLAETSSPGARSEATPSEALRRSRRELATVRIARDFLESVGVLLEGAHVSAKHAVIARAHDAYPVRSNAGTIGTDDT